MYCVTVDMGWYVGSPNSHHPPFAPPPPRKRAGKGRDAQGSERLFIDASTIEGVTVALWLRQWTDVRPTAPALRAPDPHRARERERERDWRKKIGVVVVMLLKVVNRNSFLLFLPSLHTANGWDEGGRDKGDLQEVSAAYFCHFVCVEQMTHTQLNNSGPLALTQTKQLAKNRVLIFFVKFSIFLYMKKFKN